MGITSRKSPFHLLQMLLCGKKIFQFLLSKHLLCMTLHRDAKQKQPQRKYIWYVQIRRTILTFNIKKISWDNKNWYTSTLASHSAFRSNNRSNGSSSLYLDISSLHNQNKRHLFLSIKAKIYPQFRCALLVPFWGLNWNLPFSNLQEKGIVIM